MADLPAQFKDGDAPSRLTETELSELWHDCSDLQQAWMLEYMENGFNATQAAKDAGYQASSEQTFRRIGADNKNHPRLRKLRQALMERHMTADEALSRLAEVARGDMQDFLTVTDDGQPVFDYKKAQERGALHLIKEIDLERTEDPETGEVTTEAKIKLYDKQKALTSILDVLGAGDEGEDDPTVQLNQQINNYLKGSGDTPFDDVDNEV